MSDLEGILLLWSELKAAGADYVLATVIAVEGPSYRGPGAFMLLAQDGRRAGTISGGCLEAEVARRAWWLTANGQTIQRYSTAEEDGDRPFGSGCGGVVWLFLERSLTADPILNALRQSYERRIPLAVATVVNGKQAGRRAFAGLELQQDRAIPRPVQDPLQASAERALAEGLSMKERISADGVESEVWTQFVPGRRGLWIFGAGDDALPLLQSGKALGWYVAVADGRSRLATRERFPPADELHILAADGLSAHSPAGLLSALANLRPQDAAVVMSHSFEQDSRALAALLALKFPLAYIGVLGPQRRTRDLLAEAARLLKCSAEPVSSEAARIEHCLAGLHAPTGLDLGGDSPETIALSVVAEIQKIFAKASGRPLREVRAYAPDGASGPTKAALPERQGADSLARSGEDRVAHSR